jgi:hypothetical protein
MFQKIIAFLFFSLITFIAVCQQSSLVILNPSGTPFYITLNNEPVNKNAETNVKAFNIQIGWNILEIKTVGIIKSWQLKDSIYIIDQAALNNKEFTYSIIEKDTTLQLKFISTTTFSGNQKPTIPDAPIIEDQNSNKTKFGNLYYIENKQPKFYNNIDSVTTNCKYELTAKDIDLTIDLLKTTNDSETIFMTLNQFIQNNCYTVNSFVKIINQITIELDKLTLSKKAYPHFTDKENIVLIYPIFKFNSVKQSYQEFLKEQDNIQKQKNMQCQTPINDPEFEKIYLHLKQIGYENEKLDQCKKMLINNCLSSLQIKKLNDFFTHDRERLDFLKAATPILTDKENIKTLAEELQFKESKTEFLNFISK